MEGGGSAAQGGGLGGGRVRVLREKLEVKWEGIDILREGVDEGRSRSFERG